MHLQIGLIDVDSIYPNLALMKLSAFHKKRGDQVEFFEPLKKAKYDLVYASKIFQRPHPRDQYVPKAAIKGGSGFNITLELAPEIERIYPDYSLYDSNIAMGYITRGCNKNCQFCLVHQKEGNLHKVGDLSDFWKDQKKLLLLDNSLTDHACAKKELEQIRDLGIKLNLTQGFNVRTIKPEIAKILNEIKLWPGKKLYFSWDNFSEKKQILKGIQVLFDAGIKPKKLQANILTGFNTRPNQDIKRVMILKNLGIDSYIMRYRTNPYLNALAKWVNRKVNINRDYPSFWDFAKSRTNYKEILDFITRYFSVTLNPYEYEKNNQKKYRRCKQNESNSKSNKRSQKNNLKQTRLSRFSGREERIESL